MMEVCIYKMKRKRKPFMERLAASIGYFFVKGRAGFYRYGGNLSGE